MKHTKRGKCLIFNNRTFDASTRLNERRGTEIDAKELFNCFRSLDFETNIYADFSAKDVMGVLHKSNYKMI